ncbi:hypothetical protein [Methylosarcina fibrata]|uniref:hypothetical protein n=1 Tax=Methylosarcina fibrata TaxID=105972 RepID=UPI001E4203DD|nr:hypothetical protein [Methylosarcina fibrata]
MTHVMPVIEDYEKDPAFNKPMGRFALFDLLQKTESRRFIYLPDENERIVVARYAAILNKFYR